MEHFYMTLFTTAFVMFSKVSDHNKTAGNLVLSYGITAAIATFAMSFGGNANIIGALFSLSVIIESLYFQFAKK